MSCFKLKSVVLFLKILISLVLSRNFRPLSVLPTVSKIFERIMQKQVSDYIGKFVSPFLCGYRKGFSTQYALLTLIERWKFGNFA